MSKTTNKAVETVKKTAVTEVKATVEPDKPKVKSYDGFIYVGANLPRGVLQKNTIFKGTKEQLKQHYNAVFEKFPTAEKLFVTTAKLNEAKASIDGGNGLYAVISKTLQDEINGIREVK